jgi:hypothetical protein
VEENVQREVETLKGMVLRWKRDYLESAPSDGGAEFLAQDFLEEIDSYVYPFVRRLYECNHLSGSEAKEFLDFCYNEVQELRNALSEAEENTLTEQEGRHA